MSGSAVRVLHATSDLSVAGVGRYLEMVVKGLAAAGLQSAVQLAVACPAGGEMERLVADMGLPLVRLPVADRSFSWANLLTLTRYLRARMRQGNPVDVVHAHASMTACIAARLCGTNAVVITRHGPGRSGSIPADVAIRLPWRRWVSRVLSDSVLAVSEGTRLELVHQGVAADMITVIGNGIDAGTWTPRFDRRQPTVAVTARLSAEKGHELLLQAAKLVVLRTPYARFWLIGEGRLRQHLERQTAQMDLADKVRFLGFRSDLRELYEKVSVAASPSLYEGLPFAIMEFMAAGIPVVATDVAGHRDLVVHGETGLLVPPGDDLALADSLATLLEHPERARRMGLAGRQRVISCFGADVMAAKLVGCYRSLVEEQTP